MSTFFDESSTQYFDTLQTTPDANASVTDGQTFGHDAYANSAFDPNSLTDSYQTDHFAIENKWDNNAMDQSANQGIDSTVNDSSFGDANYLNATTNPMSPAFQHPPPVHVSPDTFHAPDDHQWHSEPASFASTTDVYVSGDIDHYHHIVTPTPPYYTGGGGEDSSTSNSSLSHDNISYPEPTNCVDANNDGQCDSGSSGDGGSCGSSDND